MARHFRVVALLALTGCVTSSESSYRPTDGEISDIYAAAIRFRLATAPLAAHGELDIFLNLRVVPGLSSRLSEYRVRIHSGGADPQGQVRWYWLHLGRVTSDKAFVSIRGTGAALRGLELRKRGGVWVVVDDQEMILTYHTETPSHAMERTATRREFTSGATRTPPLATTLALSGRRSSYSR
jgi:hypothetical protein